MGIGALIGTQALAPDFTVHNHTAESIVLAGGLLETAHGRYATVPVQEGHEQWFTVPPHHAKRITLTFPLPQPVFVVLKDPVVVTLSIHRGAAVHTVAIPMVRR